MELEVEKPGRGGLWQKDPCGWLSGTATLQPDLGDEPRRGRIAHSQGCASSGMDEKALTAVVQEASRARRFEHSVDDLVQAIEMSDIFKSQVSRSCAGIDDKVNTFRGRRSRPTGRICGLRESPPELAASSQSRCSSQSASKTMAGASRRGLATFIAHLHRSKQGHRNRS